MTAEVRLIPVSGIDEIVAGDDLADLLLEAINGAGGRLHAGDVLVISSKVVAKALGRTVPGRPGEPTDATRRRLAIDGSQEVLAETPHVVVVRTDEGLVCANAGIDASNVPGSDLLLLPDDPDRRARDLRASVEWMSGVAPIGVVISDTFGRAWRVGQTDVAIGASGVEVLRDERGTRDREGRTLSVTAVAQADQLAAAADMVRRKADGVPAVIVRGLPGPPAHSPPDGGAADLIRPLDEDLFAHGRGWLARRVAAGVHDPDGAAPTAPTAPTPAASTVMAGRPGPPQHHEVDHIHRAVIAMGAEVETAAAGLRWWTTDGPAAGVVLALLLDFGYGARLRRGGPDGPHEILVAPTRSVH